MPETVHEENQTSAPPKQEHQNQQYQNQQHPNQQHQNQQHPNQQYPGQQYPSQQYPGQQYPSQQYPGQQYPSQQYPNHQYQAYYNAGHQHDTETQPYPYTSGYGGAQPAPGEEPPAYSLTAEPQPGSSQVAQSPDVEGGEDFTSFTEKSIRNGFVKKVFGILFVQLLLTAGIVCIFLFVDEVKDYASKNDWLYYVPVAILLVMMIGFGCVDSLRRKWPANIIFLFLFTVVMSVMLGTFAGGFDTDEILIALGVVVAVTLLMTILGLQTKFDFTWCLGIASILLLVMISYGFLCAIYRDRYASLAFACMGAALFSLWLLVDIQMMMGGKNKVSISPEEYIFAALQIYIDIVYIFLFILAIIGLSKN